MREMQEKAFEARSAQYLLLKAPPASGKSRALMFLALDKLINQGIKKVIVAVPERSIGNSFAPTELTKYGFFADWYLNLKYNLCSPGSDTSKVQAFKDFMQSEDKILICTHATLRFAFEGLTETDFNNCLVTIDEFHHVSADGDNILGNVMFKQVHQELKEGKRKFKEFKNAETNLKEGNFYLVDGLLAYLEVSKAEKVLKENTSGDRVRLEGRTVTIFENGTISNMLFRSLGKAIQKNGKLITDVIDSGEKELFKNAGVDYQEDISSGWIYILKSKSKNPEIASINDLYKIGLSTTSVKERIKNASKSSTYLFDEVEEVYSCEIANVNIHKFESLLHRFFGNVCLDLDIYNNGERINPREWFVAPLPIIQEAINLLINGTIINYKYDNDSQSIKLK